MKTTGVAELKAHLSRFLASVKAGGEVVVTERGRPIARIVPEHHEDEQDRMARLRRAGIAKGPGEPLGEEFLRRPRAQDPEGRLRRDLLAEREESW